MTDLICGPNDLIPSAGLGLALATARLTGSMNPAYAEVLGNVIASGVLRVGIFEDVPPFASLNAELVIEGYDTKVAVSLACLSKGIEVRKMQLSQSISSNRSGKAPPLLSRKPAMDPDATCHRPFLNHGRRFGRKTLDNMAKIRLVPPKVRRLFVGYLRRSC